ncbi:5-hydroxytryptamine receptor 3A-like [Pseudophryne corroboree]|uniref:5-hydroxytryptamine receptor 3A-like n=1 Tax=Pseudophryne corroboree TaxID=495146 RepID=UPI003081E832
MVWLPCIDQDPDDQSGGDRNKRLLQLEAQWIFKLNTTEKSQVLTTYIWYNQSWVDEFLTWDPSDFDNVTVISIPTRRVWEPDIMIIEFVDAGKSPEVAYVYVNNKGRIFNNKPMKIVTSCNLDVYYFPFDHQNCSISFASWTHKIQDISISFWRNADDTNNFQTVNKNEGEWKLISVIPNYSVFNDSDSSYGELKYFIIIRRRPVFYVVTLVLPSMFLMAMDLVGFYLPPECGERVSLKITLLLGYSVFLIMVSDHAPATGTPLISVYFILCLVLLVINLMESILIVHIVHQKNLHPEVPQWLKTLVLEKMAAWFCMKGRVHFGKSCNNISENMESSCTMMSYSNENGKNYNSQLAVTKDSEVLLCILKEVESIQERLKENDEHRITKEWLQIIGPPQGSYSLIRVRKEDKWKNSLKPL